MAGIDDYTKLMLHADNLDKSGTLHDVTFFGTPTFDSTIKKFGRQSLKFNGSTSYLQFPDSVDWELGTGDFTIDCWVRPTAIPTGPSHGGIVGRWGDKAGTNNLRCFLLMMETTTGNLRFLSSKDGTNVDMVDLVGPTIPRNVWSHVAVSRSGNDWKLFLNGTVVVSTTNSSTIYDNNNGIFIGIQGFSDANNDFFPGFIDEVRISKGIARWTAGFTPATEAYTSDNYTKLLLNMDVDASYFTRYMTVPSMSTNSTTSKFGGSYYFNGANSNYAVIRKSSDWNFGAGNFTIDFWIKSSSAGTNVTVFSNWDPNWATNGSVGIYCGLFSDNSFQVSFAKGGTSQPNGYAYLNPAVNLRDNVWHHVAIVRNSDVFTIYVDGTSRASDTFAGLNIIKSNLDLYIASSTTPGFYYTGYLEEFRVSKGIARWTANFTPSTAPYSNNRIGGTLSEAANIIVYRNSDDSLIKAETKSSGSYIIDNLNLESVNIIAIPTDTSKTPGAEIGITPVEI